MQLQIVRLPKIRNYGHFAGTVQLRSRGAANRKAEFEVISGDLLVFVYFGEVSGEQRVFLWLKRGGTRVALFAHPGIFVLLHDFGDFVFCQASI